MGKPNDTEQNSPSDTPVLQQNLNNVDAPSPSKLVKLIANSEFVAPPPTPGSPFLSDASKKLYSSSGHNIINTISLNDSKHDSSDRANRMAAKLIEDNNFTFKPKVSQASLKIAQNLNTDFMSRQQLHLEKQRKYTEQATLQFKSPIALGRLSPTTHSRVTKAHVESLKEAAIKKKMDENKTLEEENKENVPDSPEGSEKTEEQDISSEGMVDATTSKSTPSVTALKPVPTKSRSQNQLNDKEADSDGMLMSRSKTLPLSAPSPTAQRKMVNMNVERVKQAKEQAERAIKNRKVFTIQGPYSAIREAMRKRGWVEKFYKLHYTVSQPKKSPRTKKHRAAVSDSDDSDDDDDDDDDDDPDADDPNDHGGGKIPPWEEDHGIYGIMSRVVRNAAPTFIWGVRRDCIDPKKKKVPTATLR